MLDTMTAVFKNYFTTENLIDAHFYMPQSNIRIHTHSLHCTNIYSHCLKNRQEKLNVI